MQMSTRRAEVNHSASRLWRWRQGGVKVGPGSSIIDDRKAAADRCLGSAAGRRRLHSEDQWVTVRCYVNSNMPSDLLCTATQATRRHPRVVFPFHSLKFTPFVTLIWLVCARALCSIFTFHQNVSGWENYSSLTSNNLVLFFFLPVALLLFAACAAVNLKDTYFHL